MSRLIRSRKIILVVIVLVLALFLLEIMLRLGGILYLHFKYPAKPVKADAQGFNILCLGDSFTQGFGADLGKSYPEQLQELLKGQTDKDIAVYKEFRINSSTILKFLEKDIRAYDPDLIIIMTGCNDRWNMENCSDSAFEDGNFLGKIDILCSGLKVYKLVKISFLNLRALSTKKDLKLIEKEIIAPTLKYFSIPEAEQHFSLGEQNMYKGEYALALNEFNIAQRLEPHNPWVHWRKACIYIQVMNDSTLGKKELELALWYGDSSIIGYVFMFLRQFYKDDRDVYAGIKKMELIVDARYNASEKMKAKKYLRKLYLLYSEKKLLEKIIAYNLKEIIKTIKKGNRKVILMNYPAEIAFYAREVIDTAGRLCDTMVIDNHKIFIDKLKTLKKEDLFIGDGHCNANGYKLIAENIHKVLIKERIFDEFGSRRP